MPPLSQPEFNHVRSTPHQPALAAPVHHHDEAQAIAIAVASLTDDLSATQEHIDAICAAMDRVNSPGHAIEVRAAGTIRRSHASLHGEPDHPDADRIERISGSGHQTGPS